MLGFLDALCAALLARNSIEIHRLLGLPTARQLPRGVREEALGIARGDPASHVAPIKALHLYYKLSHLVDESAELDADDVARGERRGRSGIAPRTTPQIELPFRLRRAS